MRIVAFFVIALVAAVGVVAFSLVKAMPSLQDPAAPPQFLHIQTAEAGAEPATLTLPAGTIGALLAMAPDAIATNGQIQLGSGQSLPIDALRSLWAEVQTASGPVTAEHDGAAIRVEKTGDQVTVNVERNGETTQAELPAAVLDAALSAEGGNLNIDGAVQALAAQPGGAIQVTGGGRNLRVWIDTEAQQ